MLVHFLVTADAVEFDREFFIEDGIEGAFFEGLQLEFAFEKDAALDIPGGVDDDFEEMALEFASGFEFHCELLAQGLVFLLFTGANDEAVAGESKPDGVGGGRRVCPVRCGVRWNVGRWRDWLRFVLAWPWGCDPFGK